MKLPYLAILTAFTILVSCTHDPLFPSDPEPPVSATCHPDTVYFQNEILPLFTANCASAGCHGATTRIPFIFKMKFYLYSPRTALRPVATAQQILQMAFRYLRTMALWKR